MKPDTHAPGRTVEQIAGEFFVPAADRGEGPTQGADGDPENFSFQLSALSRAIVEISRNDRSPVKNLADVIVVEPLFSARLLKLAKFSSGLSLQTSTVAQAINTFGMDHLKSLALGLSLFGMESSPPKEEAWQPSPALITLRQLWEHSLGCAAMAGLVAAKIGHPAPHLVFVAGFLHDLGRLLFYRSWKERFLETVSLAIDKRIPAVEAETLGMGINHPEFGAHWASHAELPFWLQQTIRYHHVPFYTLTGVVDAKTAKIITLVQLADQECENLAISRGGDLGECSGDLWTKLNLRVEDWTEHLHVIKREIEASRAIFGFDADGFEEPDDRRQRGVKVRARFQDQNGLVNTRRRGQIIPFPARRETPRVEASGAAGTDASPDKLTILVVEDHGSLCEMLSLCLMRFGYHVRTASDGKAALDILAREKIHLVLLDLMLPRVDGFTVLKHLPASQGEKMPYVIVVSAGASEKDRNKVLELGADEYMPKPFHLTRLLERVQTVEKYLL